MLKFEKFWSISPFSSRQNVKFASENRIAIGFASAENQWDIDDACFKAIDIEHH